MTVSCGDVRCEQPDAMRTYPQHVELEQGLASLAEAVVEELEAPLEEGGDGEEMGAGEKHGGVGAGVTIVGIEAEDKENE